MARLRGNAFFHAGMVGIALRLIPKIRDVKELNLPPIIETFTQKKQGFFLVVGPVGQGKSTTLAAMIDLINRERKEHIVTIEDPIEYIFEQRQSIIDQREVGIDTKDFHSALLRSFRQDVDVIMIGEMRDAETISTAVTAAETGHLVLSTLHTNNASQTIDRIIDSFPSGQQGQIRIQLASSLLGIFSQRLIKRVSGGLIPAYELLINNKAVANLIREQKTQEIDIVIETGFEQGMVDMNRSLVDLVRIGVHVHEHERKRLVGRRTANSKEGHQRFAVQKILGIVHRVDRLPIHFDGRCVVDERVLLLAAGAPQPRPDHVVVVSPAGVDEIT